MKRREFWKFLAAAPAAAVAPLLASSKPKTELSGENLIIEGNSVTLMNCNIENTPILIKGGSENIALHGVHLKHG